MKIILVIFVQGFELTIGTFFIGLVVSRITGLQHESLDIFPPQIFYGDITKLNVVYFIKEYFIIEVVGATCFVKVIYHNELAISVHITRDVVVYNP